MNSCMNWIARSKKYPSCLSGLLRRRLTASLKWIGVDLPDGVGVKCAMSRLGVLVRDVWSEVVVYVWEREMKVVYCEERFK